MLKETIARHASNVIGWRTKRKILVIESDDWGSVRSKSKSAVDEMERFGLPVRKRHFDALDSLESNEDLEMLFDLLNGIKDSTNRSAVFTPMCIMGNPDFEAIALSDYQEYIFQPLAKTLGEYPDHDRVLKLWKEGMESRIFWPELHGREHVNVARYMKILQSHPGKEGLRFALAEKSLGVNSFKSHSYPNYLGALHPTTAYEIVDLHGYLKEAGDLFETYLGYSPQVFVAPNAEEPKELESTLSELGIKYINRAKKRTYPLGDGVFKTEWNFVGKINKYNQIILNRNCFFEPVALGGERHKKNWVDSCLKEIEIAFQWNKPAVISSHRVNYVGFIESSSRDKGLMSLKELLNRALKKWPDIEFMTSAELGDTIRKSKEI